MPETPQTKLSFRKCVFLGTKAFPRSFWSTRPWKSCVSASKWKPFNMFPMEGMKYYLWGQHWCSSGLWKQVEGAHANHKWEISRSRCSPSRNLKGHTWTIDWRTISLWPWSRERSRGNKRLPRLHWSFGNNKLEEIGGSRPLYSSPTMWSWGSRINFYLSTIYLIFDIWYLILHYLLSLV